MELSLERQQLLNHHCSLPGRVFRHVDSNGNETRDIQAKKLTKLLVDSDIEKHSNLLAVTKWTNPDGTINTTNYLLYMEPISEIGFLKFQDNGGLYRGLAPLTTD